MNPLARIRVFEDLPPEALERLEHGAAVSEPGNGAELFNQDDPVDALYAIIGGEGRVRLGAVDRRSKRLMVEVFGAGEIFGEIGVVDGGTRTASAVVDGRVRLMRIATPAFMSVLRDTPALGINLATMLSQRLRRTFALFQDATFETVEVRLARQILYLGELHGRRTQAGIVLGSRLKQHDLADLLGATTRSISTVMHAWRLAGMVHYDTDRARVTISDEQALRALLDT